jgi:hypothetical protein
VSELVLYAAAATAYVVLGVLIPEILFAWPVGAAFLLVSVWVIPALVRRLR